MNHCSAFMRSLLIGQYLDRISGLSKSIWCSVSRTWRSIAELHPSFVRSSLFFGCLLVSRECSFILSAAGLEVSTMHTLFAYIGHSFNTFWDPCPGWTLGWWNTISVNSCSAMGFCPITPVNVYWKLGRGTPFMRFQHRRAADHTPVHPFFCIFFNSC